MNPATLPFKTLLRRRTQPPAHLSLTRNYSQRGTSDIKQAGKPENNKNAKQKEEGSSVLEGAKKHLEKEIKTAKEMVKDVPEKVKQTTEELKDLGGVAAEAAKKDLRKAAEKIGLVKEKD